LLHKTGNLITVIGSNFGNKGSVWVEYYPLLTPDEITKHCPSFDQLTKKEKKLYCPPLSDKEKKTRSERKKISIQEYEKEYEDAYEDAYEKECDDEFKYDRTRLKEQFDVTPKTLGAREDNRIVISPDEIVGKLNPQAYILRVEKEGLLTYANSDASFEVVFSSIVQLDPRDRFPNVLSSSVNYC
jgi:hypothetical protein